MFWILKTAQVPLSLARNWSGWTSKCKARNLSRSFLEPFHLSWFFVDKKDYFLQRASKSSIACGDRWFNIKDMVVQWQIDLISSRLFTATPQGPSSIPIDLPFCPNDNTGLKRLGTSASKGVSRTVASFSQEISTFWKLGVKGNPLNRNGSEK